MNVPSSQTQLKISFCLKAGSKGCICKRQKIHNSFHVGFNNLLDVLFIEKCNRKENHLQANCISLRVRFHSSFELKLLWQQQP